MQDFPFGNMQQPLTPFLTNHSNGERGGWELGFCQIASVKLDSSRQNLTLGEKREQLRVFFRKGGEMVFNSLEGTRWKRKKGRDEWEWGGREAGLLGPLGLQHWCWHASKRWKMQYWQNWKQRITVAFQVDVAELFTLEKQGVRVAWLYIANP